MECTGLFLEYQNLVTPIIRVMPITIMATKIGMNKSGMNIIAVLYHPRRA
jgi:hypothetical protein